MPSKITFTDGRTTKYRYSADGTKLRAEYTTAMPASTKLIDYCGNMIYEDLQSKQLLVDGGYIAMDDYSHSYHFYVQDHLGNNRMVVHENGMVEQVNHYYPYGGLMAESTGWNAQRYKYNGKEFDRMHGLDWYDYGARWMDAGIGRWHCMDPICENHYDVSPYGYCLGDPISQFDPDGKKVWVFATKLPNSPIENLGGKFCATHTFVVVQKSNGNISRYEYGPRGIWCWFVDGCILAAPC